MFKIVDKPRAWAPVSWGGLTEEGVRAEHYIELRFDLLTVDENWKLIQEAGRLAAEATKNGVENVSLAALYAELLGRVAVDWRHVQAENGDPLPFSADNLARLMAVPGVFDACMDAYRSATLGQAEIRRGN